MTKKILILGGSRFHGLMAVESFSREGHEVYVLNRGKFKSSYDPGITHLIADRNDEKQLHRVLDGKEFDVVIDNNGYNRDQIKIILDVIRDKCKHYVFTSTVATYLKHTSNHKITEAEEIGIKDRIYHPIVWDYAWNKVLAEKSLQENIGDLNYTVLRMPNIFGEQEFRGHLYFFYSVLKNGGKLLLEKEIDRFSLLYARDVVPVWEKVMGNEKCFGKIFNIVDDKTYDYDEFFGGIYGDLYSPDKKALMESEKMWEKGYFPLFPWGPIVDNSLAKNMLGNSYTPIDIWGKKSLEWAIKNFADKPKDPKWETLETIGARLCKEIENG